MIDTLGTYRRGKGRCFRGCLLSVCAGTRPRYHTIHRGCGLSFRLACMQLGG